MGEQPVVKKRGCMGWALRLGCGAGLLSGLVGVIGVGILGYLYRQNVIVDPGPHIDAAHIRSIIAQESPVYYRDGTTRLGVFFEDEHRSYVSFERLPQAWVMGIVAAEDGSYWSHPGMSAKHIIRAMRDNVKAGGVVAGGSTLSQQTAKNLYYRPDRSVKSKLTELVNALRLEAHFEKREILTFYANQFHVSGNGRGLGIGARYFFDKDVAELEVEEAAFLAGLVKAPGWYDPFIGDQARREGAREKAHARTRYVLGRMVTEDIDHLVPPVGEGFDEQARATALLKAGKIRARAKHLLEHGYTLNFKKGTFRYDSNAVLDEVARRLGEAPFADVLTAAGIDDPATAGLKVVTTLDPDAQRSAVYGLWHHMTEVGTWMEALTPEDFIAEGRVSYDPGRGVQQWEFRRGVVSAVVQTPKKHLELDLGGTRCVVDREGIIRAAVAIARGAKGDKYAKAPTASVDALADGLPHGTKVWVSVREVPLEGPALCDLEVRPELQGAVVVLEHGEIRAMVGGNDNRNFNRTTALRQMGSTWKPLVFHAALQLGWSPADELDNRRNVFPFSTTYYYPRPDHEPEASVSMSWAGVNSENLASVWLLYHLTDRLDGQQVKSLARSLDLARRKDESAKEYTKRIQELGVLPTRSRLDEGLFLAARQEVFRDMARAEHPEDSLAVQSLYYGWGFSAEGKRLAKGGARNRAVRSAALKNSWTHLRTQLAECRLQYDLLDSAWRRGRLPVTSLTSDLSVMVGTEGIEVACGLVPEGYGPIEETLEDVLLGGAHPEPLETDPSPRGPRPRGLRLPFGQPRSGGLFGLPRSRPALVAFEDVVVEERFHASTLGLLGNAFKRQQLAHQVGGATDLYTPDLLYWHQDFRVLLSLRYLQSIARQYGVASKIQPVLSLPLGANDITLEEIASVYSGITSGQSWSFPGEDANGAEVGSPPAPALLIAEIRDVDDNVLYRATPEPTSHAAKGTPAMTADILRNVVLHGTGRRAKSAVMQGTVPVPIGGKTGTTNDFRNAAFVGFAPGVEGNRYGVDGGFIIAVYVGYDDNREMKNGRIRLAGASGALPAWMTTISGMQRAGLLGELPEGVEAQGGAWPLATPTDLVRVAAGEGHGRVVPGQAVVAGGPSILVPLPTVTETPTLSFVLRKRPIRLSPRTDEARAPIQPGDLWGRRKRKRRRR